MKTTEEILRFDSINKDFFGVQVLYDISFALRKGEILGLVGENGAGKSTLMNILGGILPASSGDIYYSGELFEPKSPKNAEENGIAFIHQELSIFLNLSIADNIFIDGFPKKSLFRFIDRKNIYTRAQEILDLLGLETNPSVITESISAGQRQIVEIAKAIQKNPRIVIFDEPTTSLSSKEKNNLFKVIKKLREQGTSIIYISHILEDVIDLCERIVVLRNGKLSGILGREEADKNKLIKLMVGKDIEQMFPDVEKEIGKEIFYVKDFSLKEKVKDINFSLREGEIVGLFGLMGAGRTELVKGIFGVDKVESGEIWYGDRKIEKLKPEFCISENMAFVTEERRIEGLFMPRSVKENISCTVIDSISDQFLTIVNGKKEQQIANRAIADLQVKAQNLQQEVRTLSGGNQQKVVISKWLMTEPKILLLDEPTRGIDVGAKYEIYVLINNLAKAKSAILFISSEMEEVIGICDRILVMKSGKLTGNFERADFDQEKILRAAIEGSR